MKASKEEIYYTALQMFAEDYEQKSSGDEHETPCKECKMFCGCEGNCKMYLPMTYIAKATKRLEGIQLSDSEIDKLDTVLENLKCATGHHYETIMFNFMDKYTKIGFKDKDGIHKYDLIDGTIFDFTEREFEPKKVYNISDFLYWWADDEELDETDTTEIETN